jgi:hypothetical protein
MRAEPDIDRLHCDGADTTIDKWPIGAVGRWPPSRDRHGQLTSLLATYGQTIFSRHAVLVHAGPSVIFGSTTAGPMSIAQWRVHEG